MYQTGAVFVLNGYLRITLQQYGALQPLNFNAGNVRLFCFRSQLPCSPSFDYTAPAIFLSIWYKNRSTPCFSGTTTQRAYHCLPLGYSSFGYIAKSLGPQDVLSILSICSTVTIAIVAKTYGPFTCIPAILLYAPFHPFIIGLFLETYQQVDQATR